MDLYELIIWGLVALAAWVLQVAKSRQARKVEAPPAPAPQTEMTPQQRAMARIKSWNAQ